jgi:adenine-specific DNA methylase
MPTFIETQFPIARLSAEAYKERKAGASQTLTGLGKWWGRKPLILVRASILGMLMPASADAPGSAAKGKSLLLLGAKLPHPRSKKSSLLHVGSSRA